MDSYVKVITRIAELILKGDKTKNGGVVSIRGYYILATDVKEFEELLEIEKNFYTFLKKDDSLDRTTELLEYCKKQLAQGDTFASDYELLINIIRKSLKMPVWELFEHSGCFISKEYKHEFLILCKKLKLGKFSELLKLPPETRKSIISTKLNNNRAQFKRIELFMSNNLDYKLVEAPLIRDNQTQELENIIKPVIPSQRKDQQSLKEEMMRFDRENLNIDELVLYFSTVDGLMVNDLKILINVIGIYNYQYLIDQLFEMGTINTNDYINIIVRDYLNHDELFHIGIDKYIKFLNDNSSIGFSR